MSQVDVPVQTDPPETAVTAALRRLAHDNRWCVTHTTDGGHAATSLHYVGRAVDLADFSGPGWDTPLLLAINQAVVRVVPHHLIQELIYAGPGGICMHNGVVVNGYDVYGADTMSLHHNHNHLGVTPDYTYVSPVQGVKPMYDPPLQVAAALDCPTGGTWLVAPDGSIYAFGGAPYLGGANGKDYFVGRIAARLNLVNGKYQIVATSGEKYGPGF